MPRPRFKLLFYVAVNRKDSLILSAPLGKEQEAYFLRTVNTLLIVTECTIITTRVMLLAHLLLI